MVEIHKFIDVEKMNSQIFKNKFFEVAVSISKKNNASKNEDASAIILGSNHLLIAVADGMGGHPNGEIAAETAIEQFCTLANYADRESFLTLEIINVFYKANQEILANRMDAGTTLTILEIVNNQSAFYLVGDSKIMIFDNRGEVKLETLGHSFYDLVKEANVNDQIVNDDHHLQNTLSSCMGTEFYRLETCSPFKINKSDLVVAGSDGLFDSIEVETFFEHGLRSPREASHALMETALEEMYDDKQDNKRDDITILCARRI